MRMKDERVPKKSLKAYTEWKRTIRRPRGRWTCSGQGCVKDVEMKEVEKVGKRQRCLEAED
jgi:hypothetical protein